ncbi:hypothetical protein [Sulfuricurvum sp.]|uniref:hypothetical protein n=1 Tax=Sulfuricurvum sp. TaxID=2025608 RepID=UPI00260D8C63|nr:hypothetical protein [Sulfuricurvum sp.]MDD2780859.1 hypothetical protein [Sulfuricurvum sp.]
MNIKTVFKYTLITVPLLFLAKCAAESAMPDINFHPVDKMRIYGKTSFGQECKLLFNVKYAPNDSFGMRQTQWIKVPTNLKKDGSYEAIVYKDYFTQMLSTWNVVAFNPEFQCQFYSQGGIAMLNLSEKSTVFKRQINCTHEDERLGKRVTCAVSNTHSIGFEEVSNSQKELEINIADKGLNAPYYELIK